MNKILLLNGFLLLTCIGTDMFLTCWQGGAYQLRPNGCATFATVSLLIPLLAYVHSRRKGKNNRKEIIALLVFNPLMFSFIAWTQQVLPHEWSLSELAGRRTIVLTGYGSNKGLVQAIPAIPSVIKACLHI